MASEAQRLIGISLTKIAQSRAHRGGVSLHKNLLVATVLQKARYIFMEEAYNMVHYQPQTPVVMPQQQQQQQQRTTPPIATQQQQQQPEEDLVGVTAEEASDGFKEFLEPACVKCQESQQDKENHPPYHSSGELTYLDLDKNPSVLRERSNSPSLKRRRAVAEWETEEAVQSILPKRSKSTCCDQEGDDSVFLDDATILSDTVSKEMERAQELGGGGSSSSAMEIDRITSLVSIFSFGMSDGGKLNRSVSTPDLCSAQAKDAGDAIQQRPFLAMTV